MITKFFGDPFQTDQFIHSFMSQPFSGGAIKRSLRIFRIIEVKG